MQIATFKTRDISPHWVVEIEAIQTGVTTSDPLDEIETNLGITSKTPSGTGFKIFVDGRSDIQYGGYSTTEIARSVRNAVILKIEQATSDELK